MTCMKGGGLVPDAKITVVPGYQGAVRGRRAAWRRHPTAAVGFITEPKQADDSSSSGKADLVPQARQFLVDAYWPVHAAKALGVKLTPPKQYARAWCEGRSET